MSYLWNKVAIVGVGLIGGSIGAALISRKGITNEVVGIGRREESLKKAQDAGIVHSTTTNLAEGVLGAELIVVCTPVEDVVPKVRQTAGHCDPKTIITDAGSTKARIVEEIESWIDDPSRFIGSHPLAGGEKGGPEHAVANLFENRTVVITPTEKTAANTTETIQEFWESLGASVVRMTPGEHDAALAITSHLPHAAASALAGMTPRELLPLVAGGWQDTTRIAAGDAELWRQIFSDSRPHLLPALKQYIKQLETLHKALKKNDQAAITALLQAGREIRDSVGS